MVFTSSITWVIYNTKKVLYGSLALITNGFNLCFQLWVESLFQH
jgi:hypothetical protein